MAYVLEQFVGQSWEALTPPMTETDVNLCGAIYRTKHPGARLRIVVVA